jgi:chemotaxis protein MotB
VRLLIVREGFSPDRLSAAGFAAYHPVATNLTAAGRGMNRRVDVIVLGAALPVAPFVDVEGRAAATMPSAKRASPQLTPASEH